MTAGRSMLAVLLMVVAALACPLQGRAQIWNLSHDFSSVNNPNGVWSYGSRTTVNGPLDLYTDNTTVPAHYNTTQVAGWAFSTADVVPMVIKNVSATDWNYDGTSGGGGLATLKPGEVLLHPSSGSGRLSVARWTAPSAGRYGVNAHFTRFEDVQGLNSTYFVLLNGAVLPGGSGKLTGFGNADSSAVFHSDVLSLSKGDTVEFAVGFGDDGTSNTDGTTVNAVINALLNDTFSQAHVIAGTSGRITDSNVGATKEAGESNHLGVSGGHSVWYRWKAPRNGAVAFSTAFSDFDTVLAVYTGSAVNHLTHIAGNDDIDSSKTSWLSFQAVAGTTYSLVVDGHGTAVGNVGLSWTQGGSDFNADGLSDLVTQNTGTQQSDVLCVSGPAIRSRIPLNTPAGWNIVGVGDFDGDGMPDLLLFNPASRQVIIAFVIGSKIQKYRIVITLQPDATVVGVGDFNGDGRPDILLEGTGSQQATIFYLVNGTIASAKALNLPAGWRIAGAGEFDNDGAPDLVLANPSTGQIIVAYVVGSVIKRYRVLLTPPSGFAVAAVGDFNSDGLPDLALESSSTRLVRILYLANSTIVGTVDLTRLDIGQHIVAPH